jgi:hypothetical protein
MDSSRKVSRVFNNSHQGSRLTDGGTVYKHILLNAKLQTGKRG